MGKFQIPTDSDALVDKDKITKERKYEQNDSSCSNKNDMIKSDGKKRSVRQRWQQQQQQQHYKHL